MTMQDSEIVQTNQRYYLNAQVASQIRSFHFVEGLCAVDHQNPSKPRDRKWYLNNVIAPLIAEGKLGDGTRTLYDDRKFRLDGISINGDTVEVALGISHYSAFREDQERSDQDNLALQQRGLQNIHDRWAYFQRNPGVAGLVLSSTGSVYLGQRVSQDATAKLNSVAGHMTYKDNLCDINIKRDLQEELAEEMGISTGDIVLARFVGAYGHPIKGDMDFAWIVRTSLSDKYFSVEGAWRERRKSAEHESLIRVATPAEIRMLLEEGRIQGRDQQFEIMYSTRGALENLRSNDFRSL